MPRTTRWAAGAVPLAALSVLLSCTDHPTQSTPPGKPIQNLIGCRVEVATGSTRCEPLSPEGRPAGQGSLNLIPDAQWMVETQAGAYTTADSTYRFNLRVTNDTEAALGTPDGTQVTGLKVFLPVRVMGYARQPGNTADPYGILIPPIQNTNNTVHARNPDGVASFTAEAQPYWHYPQILQPWESTDWKEWQFTVNPGVAYFYFAVSIFTHAPGERPMTSETPGAWLIPEDSAALLFTEENLIVDHPRMSGPYPRDLVLLRFTPDATADERQAAIDQAGGVVVGGNSAYYYVKVASGAEPVWTAVDRLRTLPRVEQVMPYVMGITTAYQRPDNGAGWKKTDWQVHRDSARGENWAPEAVNAPAAWGCETGNADADVAVVDLTAQHGGWVSSIIRNPGNTASGMVGMMWGGDMTTYNASTEPGVDQSSRISSALRNAIVVQKAKVINISLSRGYFTKLPDGTRVQRLPNPASPADSAAATASATFLRTVLATHEAAAAHQPLYVIAAGNFQVDAFFSGYAQLASGPLASRLIVVAGHTDGRSGSTRPLWANSGDPIERGSNTGSLPSIAAPASPINILGATSETIQGTSFAAPHVAGIAGLLFSQVGTRDAATVRSYILEGATRGGRTAGGYPIANAYESLKRGAEDTGAPLCGNRVWAEGAQLYVQRGSGKEALGSADAGGDVRDVLTQHGGRVVLYNNIAGQGRAMHRQANGTWALGAIPGDFNGKIGGATWSERAYSHGADSLVELNTSLVNNNSWWRTASPTADVPIVLRSVGNPAVLLGRFSIPNLPEPEENVCVERVPNGSCTYTLYNARYWLFRVAYPQAYQPVLITVTSLQTVFAEMTPWRICTRDPSLECRNARSDFKWSGAKIYRIPITGGTPQLVDSIPHPVFWIGQSEVAGSDTMVMGSGRWISEFTFNPDTRSQPRTRNELPNCAIEYRSLATLATVGQSVNNPNVCYWSSLTSADDHGGGTFSPLRAPAPAPPGDATSMRIDIAELLRAAESSGRR